MLTEEESDALHDAWAIPGPGRALFQEAGANLSRHSPAHVDTHNAERGPLLLTSGTDDHTVPMEVTKEVFALYAKGPSDAELHLFEGRGHSLSIDSGWKRGVCRGRPRLVPDQGILRHHWQLAIHEAPKLRRVAVTAWVRRPPPSQPPVQQRSFDASGGFARGPGSPIESLTGRQRLQSTSDTQPQPTS